MKHAGALVLPAVLGESLLVMRCSMCCRRQGRNGECSSPPPQRPGGAPAELVRAVGGDGEQGLQHRRIAGVPGDGAGTAPAHQELQQMQPLCLGWLPRHNARLMVPHWSTMQHRDARALSPGRLT